MVSEIAAPIEDQERRVRNDSYANTEGWYLNEDRRSLRMWLAIVLSVAILARAGLWLAYPLAQGNDTPTYLHLANSLRNNGGFERYNGTRTPGYPLFLMLTGTGEGAYILQLFLGLLTTLLVFYIGWRMSNRAWFAGLLALAHTLNLGQLFFEGTLLSESVATFFLFFILGGLVYLLKIPEAPARKGLGTPILICSFALGLAATALALTRPLFAFVPFWGAFFLVFFWRTIPLKLRLGAAALAALPALVALLVWVNFIYTRFNIVGMDSIGGYHLVNHTTSFFELAPDEYAPIRDTFLQFRAKHIAETGSPINTIWDAIPTLMLQTRLNYYSLGRLMGVISSRLIAEHPWLYLQNLALGWWWFWRVGVFWLPETLANSSLRFLANGLMLAERGGLFVINILFLGGSLALLWPKVRARFGLDTFLCFAVSAVWVTSILQTLAEHGDNPRFLAPMQTLVVMIVAAWLLNSAQNGAYPFPAGIRMMLAGRKTNDK
jgi:4-amino-4-deoxy-L-arabinose transferase-like glycosyltransferase